MKALTWCLTPRLVTGLQTGTPVPKLAGLAIAILLLKKLKTGNPFSNPCNWWRKRRWPTRMKWRSGPVHSHPIDTIYWNDTVPSGPFMISWFPFWTNHRSSSLSRPSSPRFSGTGWPSGHASQRMHAWKARSLQWLQKWCVRENAREYKRYQGTNFNRQLFSAHQKVSGLDQTRSNTLSLTNNSGLQIADVINLWIHKDCLSRVT